MSDRFAQVVTAYGPKLQAEFGLTVIQGCGFWGNFGRETGGFTHYQEIGSGANTGGRSWAQWTASRRVAFLAFCKTHSLDPKSDEAGYGFLCHELHGAYASVIPALKKCTTIKSAVSTVERLYEGAGVKAMADREAWAQKALAILHPAPPSKPKPIADKHAVAPKKAVPVRKRAAHVAHVMHRAKAKR